MERRIGSRGQVDFPVRTLVDGFWHDCRAIDISPTGMVFSRTPSLARRRPQMLNAVTVGIGEAPIPACARTVWSKGRLVAVRFVVMHDVDRLDIAEHLDKKRRLREPLH